MQQHGIKLVETTRKTSNDKCKHFDTKSSSAKDPGLSSHICNNFVIHYISPLQQPIYTIKVLPNAHEFK